MKKIILLALMLVGVGATSLIAQEPIKGQVRKSEVQTRNDIKKSEKDAQKAFKKAEKERKKAEKKALKAQRKANNAAVKASTKTPMKKSVAPKNRK